MNPTNQKYFRRISLLLILSYLFLLTAGITDLHKVDIAIAGHFFEMPFDQPARGSEYLYNDENRCNIHQVFTSIHQVIFYISLVNCNCIQNDNSIHPVDDITSGKNCKANNLLRAPPLSA